MAPTVIGTLEAITHDATTVTSQFEDFYRQETGWSGCFTRAPTRNTNTGSLELDLATSCDMRAPSAATGVYALECAMDELAVALKLDPLELRLRCYSDRDQTTERPYSRRTCRLLPPGCRGVGWQRRNAEPRSMRDGSELVGWGMATGVWEALQMPIAVRIALRCQWSLRKFLVQPPTSARAPTRSWRKLRPTCSGCRSKTSAFQAWRFDVAAIAPLSHQMHWMASVSKKKKRAGERQLHSITQAPPT